MMTMVWYVVGVLVNIRECVDERIVIPVVVGSSPISHPNKFKQKARFVEPGFLLSGVRTQLMRVLVPASLTKWHSRIQRINHGAISASRASKERLHKSSRPGDMTSLPNMRPRMRRRGQVSESGARSFVVSTDGRLSRIADVDDGDGDEAPGPASYRVSLSLR